MMKYFVYFLFFLSLGSYAFAQNVLPKPNPMRLVVDEAKVLSADEATRLENKLVALDDNSSNQIAVVLIPTLNDVPIEDVAVNTFRAWGIGNKKTNNGVLLLVAVNDHKARIEVGNGLEGAIPDIIANQIINNDLKPAFKRNAFYEGLDIATTNLGKAAVGEYKIQKEKKVTGKSGGGLIKFIIILIIVVFFLFRGGGGGGGGWIIPMMLMNSGGGRSSFGDGGDSGGGFGGFGGGTSSGGGASGSW